MSSESGTNDAIKNTGMAAAIRTAAVASGLSKQGFGRSVRLVAIFQ